MNTDPDKSPLIAISIGIVIGIFIGMALVHYFDAQPLREAAIKKGYAAYALKDTANPNSVEFVWK